MKSILRALDLGNSVAEFDEALEKYFVENEAFHSLVEGKIDIVAGDKGTGKTALYRIIQKRHRTIPQLSRVEIIAGFNPAGNPIFQQLVLEEILSEGQYVSVWKTYVLSLAGNWLLEIFGEDTSSNFKRLSEILRETGLRSQDNKPESIFGRIISFFSRKPSSAEIKITMSETGIPIITPKVSFTEANDGNKNTTSLREIRHEEALRTLDVCPGEIDLSAWIALDRLDEAFQGFPAVEVPALRALFRTYLDLLDFKNFRLKIFVRRDLFRRIVGNGFVNLTHINARKIEIIWGEADLLNLLCRRVRDNAEVIKSLDAFLLSDEQLFYKLFPPKVDQAERKPSSWNWIVTRIRDGNDVKPPRNLIDITMMAREEQLKTEACNPRTFATDQPLIEAESIKKALRKLSERRVEDTLLAEAGPEIANLIRKFRRAKAEQDKSSLASILSLQGQDLENAILLLKEVGFLEELKKSWKVPMLYREGLEVRQGKAFDATADADEIDDS